VTAVLDIPQAIADAIGPRKVGGTYERSAFGPYTVLNICPYGHDGMPWSMTVRWESGAVTTHCTPWNPARDRDLTGSTR
jgi:hypothetical protein